MATKDQKDRLELLWKLTETGVREDLKKIYDTGACQCEVNVPQISKQLTAQWNYTNKTPPESDTKKLFIEFARDLKKEWVKIISKGVIKRKGSVVDVVKNPGSSGQVLNFTMHQGISGRAGGVAGGASNNFKIFKEINTEFFLKLANQRKYKPLFRKEGKDGRERITKIQGQLDIGHVKALGSAGRASLAAGIIGSLDLSKLSPEASDQFKRTQDELLELGLSDTNEQVISYTNGKLKFIGTQEYTLEGSQQNKGENKKFETEQENKVKKKLQEGLESIAPNIKDFVNQPGSPTMMDTVGDMIVNTPIKKRAYKNRTAKNLTKHKGRKKAKSRSNTVSKSQKYRGSQGKAKFGLDSAIAAALPKSARPGATKEGGSGQSPEDFAQKIRSLLKVKRAINARLPAEVRRNMGRPALRNVSGRFSNSARVESILPAAQTLMLKYSYRLNPYETFENTGKKKWPTGYNPKPLIAKSIRGLALGLIDEKLTIRRD